MKIIAIWGLTAIAAAVLGGVLATTKNRDYSFWAFWCFLLPPLLLLLLIMPRNMGPAPRRRTLDEQDAMLDHH